MEAWELMAWQNFFALAGRIFDALVARHPDVMAGLPRPEGPSLKVPLRDGYVLSVACFPDENSVEAVLLRDGNVSADLGYDDERRVFGAYTPLTDATVDALAAEIRRLRGPSA